MKRNTIKQASFHAHFDDDKHGMSDGKITLIDQTDSVGNLRRGESQDSMNLTTSSKMD